MASLLIVEDALCANADQKMPSDVHTAFALRSVATATRRTRMDVVCASVFLVMQKMTGGQARSSFRVLSSTVLCSAAMVLNWTAKAVGHVNAKALEPVPFLSASRSV